MKTTVPVPKVALNPNNEHWFNSLNDNAAQSGDHPIIKRYTANKIVSRQSVNVYV